MPAQLTINFGHFQLVPIGPSGGGGGGGCFIPYPLFKSDWYCAIFLKVVAAVAAVAAAVAL